MKLRLIPARRAYALAKTALEGLLRMSLRALIVAFALAVPFCALLGASNASSFAQSVVAFTLSFFLVAFVGLALLALLKYVLRERLRLFFMLAVPMTGLGLLLAWPGLAENTSALDGVIQAALERMRGGQGFKGEAALLLLPVVLIYLVFVSASVVLSKAFLGALWGLAWRLGLLSVIGVGVPFVLCLVLRLVRPHRLAKGP